MLRRAVETTEKEAVKDHYRRAVDNSGKEAVKDRYRRAVETADNCSLHMQAVLFQHTTQCSCTF
jgi:hypothetical protein